MTNEQDNVGVFSGKINDLHSFTHKEHLNPVWNCWAALRKRCCFATFLIFPKWFSQNKSAMHLYQSIECESIRCKATLVVKSTRPTTIRFSFICQRIGAHRKKFQKVLFLFFSIIIVLLAVLICVVFFVLFERTPEKQAHFLGGIWSTFICRMWLIKSKGPASSNNNIRTRTCYSQVIQ